MCDTCMCALMSPTRTATKPKPFLILTMYARVDTKSKNLIPKLQQSQVTTEETSLLHQCLEVLKQSLLMLWSKKQLHLSKVHVFSVLTTDFFMQMIACEIFPTIVRIHTKKYWLVPHP